jgi:SAM-dependent methyltransferase
MRQEQLNASVWRRSHVVREYACADGFLDAGERAVHAHVLHGDCQLSSVLDLGVGAGRTVPLLAPFATRYVALDCAPEMVAACRDRYPGIDVQVGDARDLSRFAAGSFELVLFSFNGLDALNHAGRRRVLREVNRVLRPGGLFWFSTLNIEGAGRRMRPWRLEWPVREASRLRSLVAGAHMLARVPKRLWNYARLLRPFAHGQGWCMDTISAHDYALLVHYTSLPSALQELAEFGFAQDPVVLDSSFGRSAAELAEYADVFWFQILASKQRDLETRGAVE